MKRKIFILGIYLIINYFLIGSAVRGFDRYLTPILPVIFTISAFGIYYSGIYLQRYGKFIKYFFLCSILVFICVELYPKASSIISNAKNKDEMYYSYVYINSLKPNKIYYSGNVPAIELSEKRFKVKEIPSAWLTESKFRFLNEIKVNEIIIVDNKKRLL